jgi:ubiquinone/menaquinone biosynthesis C-methylase UbiE
MKELSIEELSELPYSGLSAYLGISGHIGGFKATKELIDLVEISDGKRVLDIGCGTGKTACYIAKNYNCEVIGADVTKSYIDKAKKLAKKTRLESKVEFIVANIFDLSFISKSFDVVIIENVLSFLENKDKAIKELVRVVEPRGVIGVNECFLLKKLEPKERNLMMLRDMEIYKQRVPVFPTISEWKELFEDCRLKEIGYYKPKITLIDRLIDRKEDLSKLKVLLRIVYLSVINKNLRKRFSAINKDCKEIEKGVSAGFGFFIGKKL